MHTFCAFHDPRHGWEPALPAALEGRRTLVLAFGTRSLLDDPAPLQALAAAFPQAVVAGCSTSGEIGGAQIRDGSVSLAVVRFERTELAAAHTVLADAADSEAAGQRLAAALPPGPLRAVFLLSPGLQVNGDALVRGLRQGLPEGVHLSGGLAGDGSDFRRTWVLQQGLPQERAVCAIGLYGEALRIGAGCRGGWNEFGPERRVTRSEGNVLHELDGQPALALYRRYLGDFADQLPGSALRFPLAMRAEPGADTVVRAILGIDEARQSLTFAGDMPEGAAVRMMRSSLDHLVAGAESAIEQALGSLAAQGVPAAQPLLALSVSCVARRLVMGERTEEEVEAVVDRLPAGSAHAGFYSYGEVAPGPAGGCADLHNQTMTLTLVAEA